MRLQLVPLTFCSLPAVAICLLSGCSSAPEKTGPEWTRQPTREVDAGYIVYVGVGQSNNRENAQFRATGIALEDLANECSVVPKGTRVEDRYVESPDEASSSSRGPRGLYTAYVKVGVEFQDCETAKKTVNPEDIRKIADVGFTQELKKYQDLDETGQMPESGEVASIEPSSDMPPPPQSSTASGPNNSSQFFAYRQYVAYQKEVVILSPPTAYQPGTPQTQSFVSTIGPVTEQIHGTETAQPGWRNLTWSHLPAQPIVSRPTSLAPVTPARVSNLTVPAAASRSYRPSNPAPMGRSLARPLPRPMPPMKKSGRGRGYARKRN